VSRNEIETYNRKSSQTSVRSGRGQRFAASRLNYPATMRIVGELCLVEKCTIHCNRGMVDGTGKTANKLQRTG